MQVKELGEWPVAQGSHKRWRKRPAARRQMEKQGRKGWMEHAEPHAPGDGLLWGRLTLRVLLLVMVG